MCHKKIILSLSSLFIVDIILLFLDFVSVLKRLSFRRKQIAAGMLISQSVIDTDKSLAFIKYPLILLLFNRL
jgi:hypothetical protein